MSVEEIRAVLEANVKALERLDDIDGMYSWFEELGNTRNLLARLPSDGSYIV